MTLNESTITQLCIYLCGSVKKGDADARNPSHFWSPNDEAQIHQALSPIEVHLLNPSKSKIDRSDPRINFGCDLYLIASSSIVLVDARTQKGVGIGAEMMYCNLHGIPVITICPRNSYYRKDLVPNVFGTDLHDWTHPFIASLSDVIVESLGEATEVVKDLLKTGRARKRAEKPSAAIEYFKKHYQPSAPWKV